MRLDPICHYIAAQLNTIVSLHTEDKICSKTYCSRYGFTDEILQRQDAKDFLLVLLRNNIPRFISSTSPSPMCECRRQVIPSISLVPYGWFIPPQTPLPDIISC